MRAYSQAEYVMSNNSALGVNEQELVYETGYEKDFLATRLPKIV